MKKLLYLLILFAFSEAKSQWVDHSSEYRPYVELKADFPLKQDFPYNHNKKPLLTVSRRFMPIIDIIEGQIINTETIGIQFGYTGNIEQWKIQLPEDGSTNYFFIVDDSEFRRRLRQNGSMRVFVKLFHNGEQTIYFTTKDFKL